MLAVLELRDMFNLLPLKECERRLSKATTISEIPTNLAHLPISPSYSSHNTAREAKGQEPDLYVIRAQSVKAIPHLVGRTHYNISLILKTLSRGAAIDSSSNPRS